MSKKQRSCPVGTVVQSFIFDKSKFTARDAVAWLHANEAAGDELDEKPNTYRARQISPSKFRKGGFRTIQITDGVEAVIGCPK